MIDLTPAWNDGDAAKQFLMHTPVARYFVHGTVDAGAAFGVRQRGQRRNGFSNSGTQIDLPAGNYRLQLLDSLRGDSTSNPTTLTIDVYDDGLEVASFSGQRASANPAEWVRLSEPFLYVEADLALTGPVEFRNGGASAQQAALVARLWPLPESHPRPSPIPGYSRACGRARPGKSYDLFGDEEKFTAADGNPHIRPVFPINVAPVPFGLLPPSGSYQVQVTGELTNLSSSPATLELDLFDGIHDGATLVHSESIAAAGNEVVAVAIDETLSLSGGWVDVRNGRADDLQSANLLIKRWWVGPPP